MKQEVTHVTGVTGVTGVSHCSFVRLSVATLSFV